MSAIGSIPKATFPLFCSLIAGALLGLAWLFPGDFLGAVLTWAAVFLFIYTFFESKTPCLDLYLGGIVSITIGFHWLIVTIAKFGGFAWPLAAIVFLFFVAISALQFALFGYLGYLINKDFKGFALTTPLSWCAVEFGFFRVFPWDMGHTQLGILPVAQIADIGGVILISFLLFWVCEAAFRKFVRNEPATSFVVSVLFLVLSLGYGQYKIFQYSDPKGEIQKIAVIQANVSIDDKHDAAMLEINTKRYSELSRSIPGPDTLIIWPESVITDWISAVVGSVGNDPRLPFFESNNPLLVGALTFESDTVFSNSALAILNSGTVLEPYNKQILMPFGEYMPLGGTFPWLNSLNPNVANFSAGKGIKVFEYPMIRSNDDSYSLFLSPLICYEDILPSLSRDAVQKGAQLLVNLTNDAWFGDTVAPYQHNLIASFRSIENRRFLVRSTNTGLTAVINPLGQTVQDLPPFEEGKLLTEVTLLDSSTIYTDFVGSILGWGIVLLVLTFAISRFIKIST